MTAPQLRIEEVSLLFNGLRALHEVSFTVRPGTVHAVIGPNGAGKSSLLNSLCAIYPVTSGRIHFGDREVTGLRPDRVAGLGIARTFQNIVVSPSESVFDNLMVGRHRLTRTGVIGAALGLGRREERVQRERVREIAEFAGLSDKLDGPASRLSYGDLKRLEFARALCQEPRLLILDEPVAGMNAAESARLGDLVSAARDALDLTIVFVEHDMGVVMSIADRVTVLNFGQVIADGTPEQVRRDPEVIGAYLGGDSARTAGPADAEAADGEPADGKPASASELVADRLTERPSS